jgi:hypothetical protein
MIGKPEWFKRRKWGGWGLFPATWQGWVYIAVFLGLIFGTQLVSPDEKIRMIVLGIVAITLFADTIDIMIRIKKDERETVHEAIAERNALWVIILVLAAGVAYQTARATVIGDVSIIDPVIIIAIVSALIAKAATNLYLDKNN